VLIVPLFHELGHYVDIRRKVSGRALLLAGDEFEFPDALFHRIDEPEERKSIKLIHLREYFSDLFAASYVGNAFVHFLREFAKGDDASTSHPSTDARVEVVKDFLEHQNNGLVSLFNEALKSNNPKNRS
jgi:hypothetical protein